MKTRKGLGKGLGMGYKNLVPMDAHIHSLSAKGVKTKYAVVYRDTNYLEGYVNNEKGFQSWLIKHNAKRMEEGEEPEQGFEFELKRIDKLDAKGKDNHIIQCPKCGMEFHTYGRQYKYIPEHICLKGEMNAKTEKRPFLMDTGQLITEFDALCERGKKGQLRNEELKRYYDLSNELTIRGKYKETKTYKDYLEEKSEQSYGMDAKGIANTEIFYSKKFRSEMPERMYKSLGFSGGDEEVLVPKTFFKKNFVKMSKDKVMIDGNVLPEELERLFSKYNDGGYAEDTPYSKGRNPLATPKGQEKVHKSGTGHTSMSVGDIVKVDDDYYMVASAGFKKVKFV